MYYVLCTAVYYMTVSSDPRTFWCCKASLFGNNDGPGHSLVYYYALREGFNAMDNAAAFGLLQRFIHNRREDNSEPTRNRLKLIPRVVNVEEWTAKAPLSKTVGFCPYQQTTRMLLELF